MDTLFEEVLYYTFSTWYPLGYLIIMFVLRIVLTKTGDIKEETPFLQITCVVPAFLIFVGSWLISMFQSFGNP